jgi:hypothetical protein
LYCVFPFSKSSLVEQLTHDPELGGSNLAANDIGRNRAERTKLLNSEILLGASVLLA